MALYPLNNFPAILVITLSKWVAIRVIKISLKKLDYAVNLNHTVFHPSWLA